MFEGYAPAHPEHHPAIQDLFLHPHWSEPLQRHSAWLGEPIAIKEATAAHFRRQSASNLLIIGQDVEVVTGILLMGLLSLTAQCKPDTAKFYILDFGNMETPHAHRMNTISEVLPHAIQYGRRRHLSKTISALADEVDERIAHEDDSGESASAAYLFISGVTASA